VVANRRCPCLLHAAAAGNVELMYRLLHPQSTESAGVVRRPCNLDLQDPVSKRTALMLAARNGRELAVRCLLEAGAGLETCDSAGRTALMLAVEAGVHGGLGSGKRHSGEQLCAVALVSAGASLDEADLTGKTCLAIAITTATDAQCSGGLLEEEELSHTLLSSTLEDSTPTEQAVCLPPQGNHFFEELLISAGADLDATDIYGFTCCHWAIKKRKFSSLGLLLEAGANHSIKDKWGRTPLALAVEEHTEASPTLTAIKLLMVHGADGETAIQVADCLGKGQCGHLIRRSAQERRRVDRERTLALARPAFLRNSKPK